MRVFALFMSFVFALSGINTQALAEKVADGDEEGGLPKTYTADDGEEVYIVRKGDANHDPSEPNQVTVSSGYVGTPELYNGDKPYDAVINRIVYDGTAHTVSVKPHVPERTLDPDRWEIVEGADAPTKTDAGTYSVTVRPKAGYQWLDGTKDESGSPRPKVLTWTIDKAQMDKTPKPVVDAKTGTITVPSDTDGGTTYPDGRTPYKHQYREPGGDWKDLPSGGITAKPNTDYEFRIAETNNTYAGTKTASVRWTPITYKVAFNANGGAGNMAAQDFTYNVAQNFRANAFNRNGYKFTGWNTRTDGKGTKYNDKQSVKNLTDTNGATVTLYAQWQKNATPTPTPTPTPKEKVDVTYDAHAQDLGWNAPSGKNGSTAGLSKCAEAVEVQLLPKGLYPFGYTGTRTSVER